MKTSTESKKDLGQIRAFPARFPGECSICRRAIEVGQDISPSGIVDDEIAFDSTRRILGRKAKTAYSHTECFTRGLR